MNPCKTLFSLVTLPALLSAPYILAAPIPHEAAASTTQASGNLTPLRYENTTPANIRKIGGSVLPPAIIHTVEPKFPNSLLRLNATCQVLLNLYIEPNGLPSNVHVIQTLIFDANGNELPHPKSTQVADELMKLAIDAVNQDKFKPATENDIPVRVAVKIAVNFQK
jgi:hypothetical protein